MVSNAGAHPGGERWVTPLPASPQAGEASGARARLMLYPLYCCYFTGHCPAAADGVVGKNRAEPVV